MILKLGVNKRVFKNIIIVWILFIIFCIFNHYENVFAEEIEDYYKEELSISRYWQQLKNAPWEEWQVKYKNKLLDTDIYLYKHYTGSSIFSQIENKSITTRPLIVWFVFNDGSISTPQIIISSGSNKYDNYWCEVIRKTCIVPFPQDKCRIFMWEGDIIDVMEYLINKNVLPTDYNINKWVSPSEIHWEKI